MKVPPADDEQGGPQTTTRLFEVDGLDLKQLAFHLGNPELPKQTTTEHHALLDARWNKEAFEFLKQRSPYGLHLQA